jgi:type III secretion protein N (ATPase)
VTAREIARLAAALPDGAPLGFRGRVVEATGLLVGAAVDGVRLGDAVEIHVPGAVPIAAQVVGFRGGTTMLLPLGDAAGVALGSEVVPTGGALTVAVGQELLGRVLDGLGRPLDGRPLPADLPRWPVDRPAPGPLERRPVRAPLATGIRAVDALLTIGEGQRVGVFAGSGVGKSTLLGMLARNAEADVNVVALVGERGREVREFLDECLGAAGLARSVVVVATSDAPPLVRLRAAHVATAIAEWFADVEGRKVLFLLDSVTRFARAQREVGLAAGEPPARQGYPPSVFAALPRLLERTGARARGAITAFYTVLVAGGDLDEPIADEVRGILDGHVVLDRRIAERGRGPAIDPLASLSRLHARLADEAHLAAAARLRRLLAAYERQRDLVVLGAYARGSDPDADAALDRFDALERFLAQPPDEREERAAAIAKLAEVVA